MTAALWHELNSILAAVELGKRVFQMSPTEKIIVDSPAIAATVLSNELMWQRTERFAVLLLDIKNRLLGSQVITIGTATETLIHPREIFVKQLNRELID